MNIRHANPVYIHSSGWNNQLPKPAGRIKRSDWTQIIAIGSDAKIIVDGHTRWISIEQNFSQKCIKSTGSKIAIYVSQIRHDELCC